MPLWRTGSGRHGWGLAIASSTPGGLHAQSLADVAFSGRLDPYIGAMRCATGGPNQGSRDIGATSPISGLTAPVSRHFSRRACPLAPDDSGGGASAGPARRMCRPPTALIEAARCTSFPTTCIRRRHGGARAGGRGGFPRPLVGNRNVAGGGGAARPVGGTCLALPTVRVSPSPRPQHTTHT